MKLIIATVGSPVVIPNSEIFLTTPNFNGVCQLIHKLNYTSLQQFLDKNPEAAMILIRWASEKFGIEAPESVKGESSRSVPQQQIT